MSDTSPAAATGLPIATSFDRRSFLATLAAAGVLTTGTTCLADPAASDAPGVAEHPDAKLLEVIEQHAEHKAAQRAYDELADEAMDRYVSPPIPETLYWRKGDFLSVCFDRSRLPIYIIDGVEQHVYDERKGLRDLLELRKGWDRESGFPNHTRPIARAEEILAAMDVWEADIKRAEDAAGITGPTLAAKLEESVLADLQRTIVLTPALTLEGLARKATVANDAYSRNPEAVRSMLQTVVDSSDFVEQREAMAMSLMIDVATVLAPSNERSAA